MARCHPPQRHHILKDTAAVVGRSALRSALPVSGAFAAGKPEVTSAKFCFIALTDSTPLFVADEGATTAGH
jgi:nitrate/nitrite transport system substrate-binding protein